MNEETILTASSPETPRSTPCTRSGSYTKRLGSQGGRRCRLQRARLSQCAGAEEPNCRPSTRRWGCGRESCGLTAAGRRRREKPCDQAAPALLRASISERWSGQRHERPTERGRIDVLDMSIVFELLDGVHRVLSMYGVACDEAGGDVTTRGERRQ
jgi:hypothetical protein